MDEGTSSIPTQPQRKKRPTATPAFELVAFRLSSLSHPLANSWGKEPVSLFSLVDNSSGCTAKDVIRWLDNIANDIIENTTGSGRDDDGAPLLRYEGIWEVDEKQTFRGLLPAIRQVNEHYNGVNDEYTSSCTKRLLSFIWIPDIVHIVTDYLGSLYVPMFYNELVFSPIMVDCRHTPFLFWADSRLCLPDEYETGLEYRLQTEGFYFDKEEWDIYQDTVFYVSNARGDIIIFSHPSPLRDCTSENDTALQAFWKTWVSFATECYQQYEKDPDIHGLDILLTQEDAISELTKRFPDTENRAPAEPANLTYGFARDVLETLFGDFADALRSPQVFLVYNSKEKQWTSGPELLQSVVKTLCKQTIFLNSV